MLLLAAASALLVYAALCDVATRQIPNWTSLAILSLGVLLRAADRQIPIALAFATPLFVFATILWRLGALGGGDVKLLTAASTIIPFPEVIRFLPMVALSGGVLALICLTLEKSAARWSGTQVAVALARRFPAAARPGTLPYGAAIAAGAGICLTWP